MCAGACRQKEDVTLQSELIEKRKKRLQTSPKNPTKRQIAKLLEFSLGQAESACPIFPPPRWLRKVGKDRKSCLFSLAIEMCVCDFVDDAVASVSWKCSTGRVCNPGSQH